MTKSKRYRVSQQDAASPVEASVTETVIDDDGNEVEVTRDLSGGNGADNSGTAAATTGDADAPHQGEGSATSESTADLPALNGADGKLVEGAVAAGSVMGETDSLKLAAGAITADTLFTPTKGTQDGSTATAPTSASDGTGDQSNADAVAARIRSLIEAQSRRHSENTPESDLTGGAGNAASPAQDADETERRRYVILSRVRLNNRMHPVGALVRITKGEHEQLAKAGAVDPDWDDHED